ncbi:MAG: hypothetical protein J07AB43_09070, partial [Candidatus Nanosalina sp. J07AB43]
KSSNRFDKILEGLKRILNIALTMFSGMFRMSLVQIGRLAQLRINNRAKS